MPGGDKNLSNASCHSTECTPFHWTWVKTKQDWPFINIICNNQMLVHAEAAMERGSWVAFHVAIFLKYITIELVPMLGDGDSKGLVKT
jgi:hypothetical protein